METNCDNEVLFVQAHLYGARYESKEDLHIRIGFKKNNNNGNIIIMIANVNERTNKWTNEQTNEQ